MNTDIISIIGTVIVGVFTVIAQYFNYKRSANKKDVTELQTTCHSQQKEIEQQNKTLTVLKGRADECESDRASLRKELDNVRKELLEALIDLNKNKEVRELNVELTQHVTELKLKQFELEKQLFKTEKELSELKLLYPDPKKRKSNK